MQKDPLIGQNLGNYHIERLLGRGGMAQVYYGWDINLDRPVAIKVIDVRYRESLAYAARFLREARTVAAWHHEHIVQIYYCSGEQEALHYFVMAYIEGMDLRELVAYYAAQGELLPYEDIITVGHSVASALDYAHSKGVIHRDVKPANVMIAADGRVVLTDFGLALDVYQGSLGEVVGSPHYLAPEQARSSAAAVPQSDLYSLGVILYELLTGAVPFDDPSSTTVAVQHITQAPPPPRALNPNLTPETEAVLLKALRKSPEDRYATGATLIEALEKTLTGEPLKAPVEEAAQTYVLPPETIAGTSKTPQVSTVSLLDTVTLHLETNVTPAASRQHRRAPLESDLVGQRLGDFRLESLLGRGGMARVYRGTESPLNRQVAVKVIDAPFRADPEYLMRFEREAQAIAKLEHPHIVRLYRYGKEQGMLYMAMQYIDGADLETVLSSYRDVDEFIEVEHIRCIVREMCEALDYAHTQGVIHRDIKPANIMITPQDHAILTDFGLALLTETGTRGTTFGSPHYIAPEQAVSSASVVPQSDLYAMGVILYEMFAGRPPFDAADPLEIAMLHISDIPRPPRELRAEILPAVEAVILKALAKEPKQRFSTGKALMAALEQALHSVPSALMPEQPSLYTRATRLHAPQTLHAATATSAATSAASASIPALPPTPPAPLPASLPTSQAVATDNIPQVVGLASSPTPPPARSLKRFAGIAIALGVMAILACFVVASVFLVNIAQRPNDTETPVAFTISPLPALPTSKPNASPSPPPTTPAVVPTQTSAPAATATPNPPTATPIPTATSTPSLGSYDFLVALRGDESLFVVNPGRNALPLDSLILTNDQGTLHGDVWNLPLLQTDECVVWGRKKDAPPPPEVKCTLVGEYLVDYEGKPFWDADFDIYHGETLIDDCKKKETLCSLYVVFGNVELPQRYKVQVAKEAKNGVFVINQGDASFPLTFLRLSNAKGAVTGEDWGIDNLEPGDCVVAWKDDHNPKEPKGIKCHQLVAQQSFEKPQRFWETKFTISYGNETLEECEDKTCLIQRGFNEDDDDD